MNATARASETYETQGLAGRRFRKAKAGASELGVCTRTIFRWADEGLISRHKINARVVLFDEAEIASFIESARVGGIRVDDPS